jgi:protein tyrosine kinase modulator
MLPGKKYDVKDYITLARRYWWIVAATTGFAAFLSLMLSASQKDMYQSEMLVQIVPQRVPATYVPPTVTARTEDRMGPLEAQVKSRSQLERLIKEFDLYSEERASMTFDDVIGIMRASIQIQLVRQPRGSEITADAFYLRFTYFDPGVAARVTTALGNLFIVQNARERGELATAANQFLSDQLVEARARLGEQEQKVEKFRQAHAGRLPTQADFNMQAINTTSIQLQSLVESAARDRDRRNGLERAYNDLLSEPVPSAAQPPPAAAGPEAVVSPNAPLPVQLQAARGALARLEGRLKPEHPDIRRQKRIVADLERRVAAEASAAPATKPVGPAITTEESQRRERLRSLKAELDTLAGQIAFKESEERRLRGVIADYQARLQAIPSVESEWIALNRDYETMKAAYESLLRKSEDSKVAEDLEKRQVGEQFKIVDPAVVPVRPIGPMRLKNNAIGAAIGLAIGCAIVVLLFLLDRTFHGESDVLDVLNLPVLAEVPRVFEPDEQRTIQRRRLIWRSLAASAVASCGYITWTMHLWRFVM